jgi:hypothetical protein
MWIYSPGQKAGGQGTVVDLIVQRDGVRLDECLKRIAACLDMSNRSREPTAYRECLGRS